MRVHDRIDVWSMTVNPKVEAVRRIHHAIALKQLKIVVYQHEIAGARLIETKTEAQHPIGAGPITTRGDLASKSGLVALGRENPASKRNLLTERPRRHSEMTLHLLSGACVVLGLITNDHIAHVSYASLLLGLHASLLYQCCPFRDFGCDVGC